MLNQAMQLSAVGLEMGLCVAIGILGGRYLDARFGTAPVLFWVGIALGLGAAAKAIVYAARKTRKILETDERTKDNPD